MNEQEDEGTGAVGAPLYCPFCGQPPQTWDTLSGELVATCYTSGCPANTFTLREGWSIARWNTRHTPDVAQAVEAERARVVAALDELKIGINPDTCCESVYIGTIDEAIAIAREEGGG